LQPGLICLAQQLIVLDGELEVGFHWIFIRKTLGDIEVRLRK
jgi:hypothetical protein